MEMARRVLVKLSMQPNSTVVEESWRLGKWTSACSPTASCQRQLPGGDAELGSHKATGDVYGHDGLAAALVTHKAFAHQALLYRLGGEKNTLSVHVECAYEIRSSGWFLLSHLG
ncbi:hypothetical protein EYF80_049171 [Liparis tanakae]|uniref:Uncharacterized protein n=1 Tax=Liparis tanakae TaxID=230148 RepID=A0A4Z2FHF9_9TELE|nr:hypothetical protein EYF80_049171 [Liparis tanakae]